MGDHCPGPGPVSSDSHWGGRWAVVPKWPVSPCGHLQCRVAPPFSSDYRHSSQAAAGAQTTTISLLKTGKKAERKMLERGLMTKGTAATAGPGMVRGGCHCVTPGPGCYTGSDVAAADSGHGRPPLAAEDRLRLVAGVLRAVPALWSALHWPPILPVSGVSAGLHRLYTDSILYSDRFFYRLALCSVQRTLDTGLGLSWAWVQTTLRPRHQMLYLARPHSQNIILFIIISCFPFLVYFLCVEPYPVTLRASVALCVLSNTLNPWSTPLTAPRSPLRVVYKMQLTYRSRGADHPDILFSMSSQLMFAPESL